MPMSGYHAKAPPVDSMTSQRPPASPPPGCIPTCSATPTSPPCSTRASTFEMSRSPPVTPTPPHHALRTRPQEPRPPPQLHPRGLHGLRHLTAQHERSFPCCLPVRDA